MKKATSVPKSAGSAENTSVPLLIDRPVAGGRMLARHEGRVVLVSGAIPGERVRARIERSTRQVIWAEAEEILERSPDRREPAGDPGCGGVVYAHVAYERQLQLKGDVIADAFRRIGKIGLTEPPRVAASPESGYRLRARLHVRDGRAGFFREGTHTLCDAAATGQLHAGTLAGVEAAAGAMGARLEDCDEIVVAENISASERVLHLLPRDGRRLERLRFASDIAGVTGITTSARGRAGVLMGNGTVSDTAGDLFGGDSPIDSSTVWRRHAASFFQANRFLVGQLVRRVLAAGAGDGCVDLYSGVGLFAVALAARGSRVIAVEGDRVSEPDLRANAAPWRDRLRVVNTAVEVFVQDRLAPAPDVVVLDPPRTGVAADAVAALLRWGAPRLVYVSCDPPTLARDVQRFASGGYRMTSLEAFDLFPNTAHVEMVVTLELIS